MIRAILIISMLVCAAPANAGCFLFFCWPSAHHHRVRRGIIVRQIVVVKPIVVHHHKIAKRKCAHDLACMSRKIAPLKPIEPIK
jgi:hypothetical protein